MLFLRAQVEDESRVDFAIDDWRTACFTRIVDYLHCSRATLLSLSLVILLKRQKCGGVNSRRTFSNFFSFKWRNRLVNNLNRMKRKLRTPAGRNDVQTIGAFASRCRTFRALARPSLFHTIILHSDQESAQLNGLLHTNLQLLGSTQSLVQGPMVLT